VINIYSSKTGLHGVSNDFNYANISTSVDSTIMILTILNVSFEHAGRYICFDTKGEVVLTEHTVTVLGKVYVTLYIECIAEICKSSERIKALKNLGG
jgi:hypothetical protein